MSFISEEIIQKAMEEMAAGAETDAEAFVQQLGDEQPAVMAYLFSEEVELLSESECDLLFYLTSLFFYCPKTAGFSLECIQEEALMDAEERNWDVLQKSPGKEFEKRLDPFYKNYPQEDLLAFVEDSLLPDEEDEHFVSHEGREVLFILLKTILDCLNAAILK